MDDRSKIRNIGVAAHIDAGKTTTTERLLFYSGTIHKMGDVDAGTTVTDFDKEEQERGITIYSAAVTFDWRDCQVNLIDTPGHVDFTAEVERSLRVLDGAIVVFDAKEGVEAQSETVWRQANRYGVPRICFLNKMDKTGADFEGAVASIRQRLHARPLPIQIPIGSESHFRGAIDLIEMRALLFSGRADRSPPEVGEIPPEMLELARAARHSLEERVAELDDALMHKYLENHALGGDEIRAALRRGTISRQVQPVLCGSSLRYMGVQPLLDAVTDFLPSPLDIPPVRAHDPDDAEKIVVRRCDPKEPLAALVFKVVAERHADLGFVRVYSGTLRRGSRVNNVTRGKKENVPQLFRMFARRRDEIDSAQAGDIVAVVGLKESQTGDTLCENRQPVLLEKIEFPETVISMSIEPRSSADRDKLMTALAMLARGDPTFRYRSDTETGQTLISGMGELHLEVICHRLERDLNIPVKAGKPRVAYRETITQPARAEGQLVRQTGGRGQFAIVAVQVQPFTPAPGQDSFQFVSGVPAGAIKPQFIAAAQVGAAQAAQSGPLGSYPLVNVRVTLTSAQEHPVDSSELAFEAAASLAVTRAVEQAAPVLLEPIMKVEIVTPEEYFGPVNGDLASRRATITGTSLRGKDHVIDAQAPLSSMFGYATALRSLSQGRASFSMEPSHYQPMPAELARKALGLL